MAILGVVVIYTLFRKYGIYSKTKILKAIQEKGQAGLTEEEANIQIAQEGNISIEAVTRIRQKVIDKEKNKEKNKEKQNVDTSEKRRTKKVDKPDEEQSINVENTETKEPTPTKPKQVSEVVQNPTSKNYIYTETKIDAIRSEKDKRQEKEIKMAIEMAKNFVPLSTMQGKLGAIDVYDIIILLRKQHIALRERVEDLIQNTDMTDEEIAKEANRKYRCCKSN